MVKQLSTLLNTYETHVMMASSFGLSRTSHLKFLLTRTLLETGIELLHLMTQVLPNPAQDT
jgi:hypothetical protein